jgi:surfactin synthase thioesterase subunit
MIFPFAPDKERGKPRIVFFHHAGGSRNSYLQLAKDLSAKFDVWLTETRLSPPSNSGNHSLSQWATSCAKEMEKWDPLIPTSLFGHSMGAWMAYEVASQMSLTCRTLVVSGAAPPNRKSALLAELDSFPDSKNLDLVLIKYWPELLPFVKGHGDPSLEENLLSHLHAMKHYEREFKGWPKIEGGILALGGSTDCQVPTDSLQEWRAFTKGPFQTSALPGGHFYLYAQRDYLVPLLARYCS